MIEGLWNVPLGTLFKIQISTLHRVTATTRWCEEDRMGVEFSAPLERDNSGRILALQAQAPEPTFNTILREAG